MTQNAILRKSYQDARVLITGGMGFIGSNLAIALARAGPRVSVVDSQVPGCGANPANLEPVRDQVQVFTHDIGDAAAMRSVVPGQEVSSTWPERSATSTA